MIIILTITDKIQKIILKKLDVGYWQNPHVDGTAIAFKDTVFNVHTWVLQF